MRVVASIAVLFTLGGFMPPKASSQPYRLVCTYFEESSAVVYEINASGTVSLLESLPVGYDAQQVTVSPDGRTFHVWDGGRGSAPPWFFVGKEGGISRAASGPAVELTSVYSPTTAVAFAGLDPCKSYVLDHDALEVTETTHTYPYPVGTAAHPESCVYSTVLGGIMWCDAFADRVFGVRTTSDGDFGVPAGPFYFADKGSNRGMDVSPDGRFVTVLGLEDPQLAVIGIRSDGTFYLVQTLLQTIHEDIGNPYRVRYTPDGRYALVLSSTGHYLVSYRVDPATGMLTRVASVYGTDWVPGGYLTDGLAITPDSRFAVIPNHHLTQNASTFMVYEIGGDGSLTRITQARNDFPGYVSDMDFIPPYREPVTAVSTGWMLYQ